jgi:hypothetical protein
LIINHGSCNNLANSDMVDMLALCLKQCVLLILVRHR